MQVNIYLTIPTDNILIKEYCRKSIVMILFIYLYKYILYISLHIYITVPLVYILYKTPIDLAHEFKTLTVLTTQYKLQ